MQRSSLSLLALGLSLSGAGEVAAAPAWLELRWPEQAGCPTRDEVEAATLRLKYDRRCGEGSVTIRQLTTVRSGSRASVTRGG